LKGKKDARSIEESKEKGRRRGRSDPRKGALRQNRRERFTGSEAVISPIESKCRRKKGVNLPLSKGRERPKKGS